MTEAEATTYLYQEQRPLHIQIKRLLVILLGHMLQIIHRQARRVRDQNVNLAESIHRLLDHSLNVRHVTRVRFDGEGGGGADLVDERFCRAGIGGVVDDYIGALGRESESGGPANTFAATGDKGDFTSEGHDGGGVLAMVGR